jgi:dienelactone hydrolase
MVPLRVPLFAWVASFASAQPILGPYGTRGVTLQNSALDNSSSYLPDGNTRITYPEPNGPEDIFPLIAYAHGAAGGGFDLNGYDEFFHQLASYGFVVAAHKSCSLGCSKPGGANKWTSCAGLPEVEPAGQGWSEYYGETLKTIEWARNESVSDEGDRDAVFSLIDWSAGVGIAGHSMGGQSTTAAAALACVSAFDIRAAAVHHPASGDTAAGNLGAAVAVPLAAFTSSGDGVCEAQLTKDIFDATSPAYPKVYRNLAGSSHLEPVLIPPIENPYLATFTAAWFDIYLKGQTSGASFDLIYGGNATSLCNYAEMAECVVAP